MDVVVAASHTEMKNIQVIDGALNAVFDIFAATDEEFALIFPSGQDIGFINEVYARAEADNAVDVMDAAFSQIWRRRLRKVDVRGIHGLLFYELDNKMAYYPTRRDEEALHPSRHPAADPQTLPVAVKHIQVIDDAVNTVYDVYAATEEEFALIFPPGQDAAFINEVNRRAEAAGNVEMIDTALGRIWKRRLRKVNAMGIHGILFYELDHKMKYYPTRRDEEAINPDGSLLR